MFLWKHEDNYPQIIPVIPSCLESAELVSTGIHVMAQIFKSGDLSNLIRSFDSISGGFLSNYFNAR